MLIHYSIARPDDLDINATLGNALKKGKPLKGRYILAARDIPPLQAQFSLLLNLKNARYERLNPGQGYAAPWGLYPWPFESLQALNRRTKSLHKTNPNLILFLIDAPFPSCYLLSNSHGDGVRPTHRTAALITPTHPGRRLFVRNIPSPLSLRTTSFTDRSRPLDSDLRSHRRSRRQRVGSSPGLPQSRHGRA